LALGQGIRHAVAFFFIAKEGTPWLDMISRTMNGSVSLICSLREKGRGVPHAIGERLLMRFCGFSGRVRLGVIFPRSLVLGRLSGIYSIVGIQTGLWTKFSIASAPRMLKRARSTTNCGA
jgi:hypothetical protein